ncbi:hypothetical protein CYMTET_46245 [Cymbomonas tetramitiformis]|uniref:ABC transporter domain-containing protein n=1 Tax=Cymbomonas tetramitiformis TaxID=36881 RepID=A0AAE0EXT0_9CHLO|nr:hypothetical protein CYMTET_46245 [Cymbomonas tetramitiformis]
MGEGQEPLVVVDNLTFTYPAIDGRPLPGVPPMVKDMNLKMYPGQCSLLLGANGAGKTTLLKILGGKHMIPQAAVKVMGEPPFHSTGLTMSGDLAYIGGSWQRDVAFAGYNVPLQGDFSAEKMIHGIQGTDAARRDEIMEMLDINPNWRMNQVSDGQRRRVQLCVGLLKPYKVLLLDEITVDLDVLGRADLLTWLQKDAKTRGACILYATHIFDGLEGWAESIAFVSRGKLQFHRSTKDFPEIKAEGLLHLVEKWLRVEQKIRLEELAKNPSEKKTRDQFANNNGWGAGTLNSTLAQPKGPDGESLAFNPLNHSSNAVLRG